MPPAVASPAGTTRSAGTASPPGPTSESIRGRPTATRGIGTTPTGSIRSGSPPSGRRPATGMPGCRSAVARGPASAATSRCSSCSRCSPPSSATTGSRRRTGRSAWSHGSPCIPPNRWRPGSHRSDRPSAAALDPPAALLVLHGSHPGQTGSAAQLRKVRVAVLGVAALRSQMLLARAQLDPADLAADRLGQLPELDLADPLEGREVLPGVLEDGERRLAGRLVPGREGDVGLGDGGPPRVRHRDDGRLGHRRVLDQHALQLERADLVVAGLEDVVRAPDVGDVPLVVPPRDVAAVV